MYLHMLMDQLDLEMVVRRHRVGDGVITYKYRNIGWVYKSDEFVCGRYCKQNCQCIGRNNNSSCVLHSKAAGPLATALPLWDGATFRVSLIYFRSS